MTPLSEADPAILLVVRDVFGPCSCSERYTKKWVGHENDPKDPRCNYHAYGEKVAALERERKKWRNRAEQLQALTGAKIIYRD